MQCGTSFGMMSMMTASQFSNVHCSCQMKQINHQILAGAAALYSKRCSLCSQQSPPRMLFHCHMMMAMAGLSAVM